jgi:hypothetical protein
MSGRCQPCLRASQRRRLGVSLIEMLVVISLLTAVSALIGRTLLSLFLAEHAAARDGLIDRRLCELAIQLRDDGHRAAEVVLLQPGTQVELRGGDVPITYTISGDVVERRCSSTPPRRDAFRLPGCHPRFQSPQPNASSSLELVVARPLPQLLFTPAAPVTQAVIAVRVRAGRYGPESGKDAP